MVGAVWLPGTWSRGFQLIDYFPISIMRWIAIGQCDESRRDQSFVLEWPYSYRLFTE